MDSIVLPIQFEGIFNKNTLKASFDNAFLYSCIDSSLIKNLSHKTSLFRKKTMIINGASFEIHEVTILDFYINNTCLSDEFMIIPNLSKQVIIGETTIRKWRIKIDTEQKSVSVNPAVAHWRL
jgi:hypothetical protein